MAAHRHGRGVVAGRLFTSRCSRLVARLLCALLFSFPIGVEVGTRPHTESARKKSLMSRSVFRGGALSAYQRERVGI